MSERADEKQAYVSWLLGESMLDGASSIAAQFSGTGAVWQNPFGIPNPRAAVDKASVWFTAYPISMIIRPSESFLAALGDDDLWLTFEAIGINALHTGPVKRAGGLNGRVATPSVDGHFDRVSSRVDAVFGTEEEYRTLCRVASAHGCTIIDDIVPGHTGKGADFRLAEMKVKDYPGIYHMVEIPAADWHLLPRVPDGHDSVNLDVAAEHELKKAGYIIGPLQRVIFQDPGVKETNWSATAPVTGPDGVERRWVYLHYFKEGQPSINWLDPSFAGMRMVIGDALHSLTDLGTGGLRLDANGFLGVEKSTEDGAPGWSEGHPLSDAANQLIASMVRKVGGFTFQELNLAIDDIVHMAERGADLSYDFVNRPAYHHAMATGDTEFLRLTLRTSSALGLQPVALVHALQNHDEMTYELVHFAATHKDETFTFRGAVVSGGELAVIVRNELVEQLTGAAAPYNAIFTTNGIASTTATVVAASLGYTDISTLSAEQVENIKRGHLLLALFNALQPGVFALSGWDLCGMLTLERPAVADLLTAGDTRWIHRPAYDLMGFAPNEIESPSGIPRGRSLYGSLPEQLEDASSFASRLRDILAIRTRYRIATSVQLDIPPVCANGTLAMVHLLESGLVQVSLLNFARHRVADHISSEHLTPGATVLDMFTDEVVASIDQRHTFGVSLAPHQGMSLLIIPPRSSADGPPTDPGPQPASGTEPPSVCPGPPRGTEI